MTCLGFLSLTNRLPIFHSSSPVVSTWKSQSYHSSCAVSVACICWVTVRSLTLLNCFFSETCGSEHTASDTVLSLLSLNSPWLVALLRKERHVQTSNHCSCLVQHWLHCWSITIFCCSHLYASASQVPVRALMPFVAARCSCTLISRPGACLLS